jgi:peptidoglycan/xylan/chitin deacetylase (PgdA/CDA1 family)
MQNANLFKIALDVLHFSGTAAALRPQFGGLGAIFMLHHVMPGGGLNGGFRPNAVLEITPEFLDQVIAMVKSQGFDLVNLDEATQRIIEGGQPFVVFTLDDGYRDNLVHALPVFRRHNCPFTVYVAPAITDGTCELWWRVLEHAIAHNSSVMARLDGQDIHLDCATVETKREAWKRLYWPVRRLEQNPQRLWIREFGERHGIDVDELCRDAAMNWDEMRLISSDPLCSIGAHTVHHYNVKALGADEARREMIGSADRIERELGTKPAHFSYPYGDSTSAGPRDFEIARQAGFRTAVTTRKGMLFRGHAQHLTALPRFSLSGDFQNVRHVKTLLSGLPFALINRFQAVNVG